MDASHESDDARRSAGRSRSAPEFCRPQPAPPRPYRPAGRAGELGSFGGSGIGNRESGIGVSGGGRSVPVETGLAGTGSGSRESGIGFGTVRSAWEAEESEDLEDAVEGAGWIAVGRGVALLLGTLLLVDLFAGGGLAGSGVWWLDTRPLTARAAAGLLGTAAACLLLFAVRGALPRGIRGIGLLCVGLLIAIAIKNTTVYYGLLKRGDLHDGPPVAFSLHIIGCLAMVLLSIRSAPGLGGLRGTLLTVIGFAATLSAFPIAQIACEGTIDGRRSAAAAIVAGPRPFEVDAEERMEQRIDRAVALHRAGLVPNLLLTVSADAEQLAWMRARALEAGVPSEEIEVIPEEDLGEVLETLDGRYSGINGEEPVLLLVSDADHLPRLLLEGRSVPVTLAGVPSESEGRAARSVYLREVVGLWGSYFRR